MSSDWDVEAYRSDYESEEHWELRKKFMLANKDKLSEDEVVALAHVFTNIEILGCRYPAETMAKVAELSKGVVEAYREKKNSSLKRTFVAASDAANAKIKGQKQSNLQKINETSNTKKQKYDSGQNSGRNNTTQYNTVSEFSQKLSGYNNPSSRKRNTTTEASSNARNDLVGVTATKSVCVEKLNGPFADFVLFLFDEHPVNMLTRNASLNKYNISWRHSIGQSGRKICSVYLDDRLAGSGEGENNKTSRDLAATDAIKKLQNSCYTVKIKARFTSHGIVDAATLEGSPQENGMLKNNIGEKIMKLMGWDGGALGVKRQGILEPINIQSQFERRGLGHGDNKKIKANFKKRATAYIKAWLQGNSTEDLIFSSEFNSEERKALHRIATNLALRSRSYGRDDKRYLVISKKISPWQIVHDLVEVGGVSSKYELILPKHVLPPTDSSA